MARVNKQKKRSDLMNIGVAALLLLGSLSARADVIDCAFTEPFFQLIVDTDAKTITRIEPDWESPTGGIKSTVISKNARVVEISSIKESPFVRIPRYQVKADGKNFMVLSLSYQGTDDMSDFAYPYSAMYGEFRGGCESDKVKKHTFHFEK
jgi:uncharacterized membrane protein